MTMRPTVHPGEIIKEDFLVPLNMSARMLAARVGVSAPTINDIIRQRRAVTPDMALRLAAAFGTTADLWLNLQKRHDLNKEMNEHAGVYAAIEPVLGAEAG